MKKKIFTLLLVAVSTFTFAQDTLRHFTSSTDLPVADTYASGQGYFTGHNDYSDEEFAEKYAITGSGDILGVIAIHDGLDGTSTMNASYKVYSVAANGLPGIELTAQSVANNDIPVNASPFAVMFSSPAAVSDEFFISFDLGDYAHTNPGTKRIALTHSPEGTRPSTDFDVFGRNAIRWHNHGTPLWKDYRTENFQDYEPAVHFSLFPIVQLVTTSVVELDKQGSSIGSVFPNPSTSGNFTIPLNTTVGGDAVFQLFDLSGKLINESHLVLSPGKTNYQFSNNELVAGTYILLINIPEGSISQKVIIK